MYEYEDFYREPSEFEMQVDELKQSLLKSVKENFVEEMDRLRAENNELQEVKKNFEQIKREYEVKANQLEYERKDLVNKVRRERLTVLMEQFQVVMYSVGYEYKVRQKCDKCNERRVIPYITPLGKQQYEDRDCKKKITVYVPKEFTCSEFRVDRHDGTKVTAWFKQYEDNGDGFTLSSSTHLKTNYNDSMRFEDVDRYGTFFRTIEDCQRFCDWMNRDIDTTESA